MLQERINGIPSKRFGKLFCRNTIVTMLKFAEKTLQSQRDAPARCIILCSWHMVYSLSEVRNMVKRLKKRIHVACSPLILKANIASLLFGIIIPEINYFTHSNLSLNNAFIIHNITFSRII
ncbi:Os01g0771350 [Oryza sativa Japonica Group]|uniref:Os01g0771350 protein n=1 Tax=Oryza sativa subsp. japonica TaxID=39947 RepID=A0A0P0V8Q9_ORYSJ|nr:Os01g0771350 [Oryza sativa Japonica Group]